MVDPRGTSYNFHRGAGFLYNFHPFLSIVLCDISCNDVLSDPVAGGAAVVDYADDKMLIIVTKYAVGGELFSSEANIAIN